jgi:hypothetical protein
MLTANSSLRANLSGGDSFFQYSHADSLGQLAASCPPKAQDHELFSNCKLF